MDKLLQLMTLLVAFCNPQTIYAYEQGMMEKHNNPSGESFKQRVALRQYKGLASWYGRDFHGKRMANGDRYNMYQVSVAHKTLPLGTRVRVTNLDNGQSIVAEVTDRGPYVKGRIVDLSRKAAEMIGALHEGVVPVRLEVVSRPVVI